MNVAEANEPLATSINEIITSKGLKKIHVAKEAGLSPQALSDILNGRRLIKVCEIERIAEAVGEPVEYLFTKGEQKVGSR